MGNDGKFIPTPWQQMIPGQIHTKVSSSGTGTDLAWSHPLFWTYTSSHAHNLFVSTAQHALLENIKPLWPACPPPSTGVWVPVTQHLYHKPFLYNYLRIRVHCGLFLCCFCLFIFKKLLAFEIILHCLKKTRTDWENRIVWSNQACQELTKVLRHTLHFMF